MPSVTLNGIEDLGTAIMGTVGTMQATMQQGAVAVISDDSITTPKIVDGAVTTDKIADGSITADKLDGGELTPIVYDWLDEHGVSIGYTITDGDLVITMT